MKTQIVETADGSIKISFVNSKTYELEFFEDGSMVFCKTDPIGETIDDISNTRILFKYLKEIEAYNKQMHWTANCAASDQDVKMPEKENESNNQQPASELPSKPVPPPEPEPPRNEDIKEYSVDKELNSNTPNENND